MAFETELESFRAYARAMPNNCIFLVDTYDTLQGVRNAATVARELKKSGHDVIGVRLDSGDLAYLSKEARKILDDQGLEQVRILASNELDENIIHSLKDQGAAICIWGVGTKLVTAYDEPAMTGVYKLTAIRDDSGQWRRCIKLSEQMAKITTPGILQIRRYRKDNLFAGDMIYDTLTGSAGDGGVIIDPIDPTRRKNIPPDAESEDILVPIMRGGEIVHQPPQLGQVRRYAAGQLDGLYEGVKRFVNPHIYPAGLEKRLHNLKTELVLKARNALNSNSGEYTDNGE